MYVEIGKKLGIFNIKLEFILRFSLIVYIF